MRLSISIPWDPRRARALVERARAAEAGGVDTIWVNEGFGHDAFSGLAVLAWETARARLGTAVVNVYSRTPGALAQHFATLDQLSNGRIVAGLGTSGAGVIERFHGLPYQPAFARLEESVALLRALWRHERVTHHGRWFDVERALVMGVDPVQPALPVHLAALHPRSVALAAETADGWLPAWIPLERLGGEVAALRAAAAAHGRDPGAVEVRAPGTVTVVDDPERAAAMRAQRRRQLAFFVARNGDVYFRQFARQGLADEAAAIRRAWDAGGAPAAEAAIPPGLEDAFDFSGPLDACRERLAEQAARGVDVHQVAYAGDDARGWQRAIERLGAP